MSWVLRYVDFWDRREDASALALVRIAVALVCLCDLFQVWRCDLVVALWAPQEDGGFGASTYSDPRASFFAWFGASAGSAYALFALSVVCASTLCVGIWTRLSALGLLYCSTQFAALAPASDRGIDGLLRNVLVVLALSGAGATWSLGARLRGGSFRSRARVPAWPRYLLILQLMLLYFWAGVLKQTPEWSSLGGYSALFRVLSTPHISRFDWSHAQLSAAYRWLQAATFGTLLFERSAIALPVLLWLRHTERGGVLGRLVRRLRLLELWVATGVCFHLSLAVLANLGIFPWGCLALYPALARPGRLAQLADKAFTRRWLRAGPHTGASTG